MFSPVTVTVPLESLRVERLEALLPKGNSRAEQVVRENLQATIAVYAKLPAGAGVTVSPDHPLLGDDATLKTIVEKSVAEKAKQLAAIAEERGKKPE